MFLKTVLAALLLSTPALAEDAAPSGFDRHTPIETLAADPAAAAILEKDIPGLLTDKSYPDFKSMNLKQIQELSGGDLSKETVDKTEADLQALFPH